MTDFASIAGSAFSFMKLISLSTLYASQIVIAVCGLWALGWGVVLLRPDESRRTD